MLEAELGGFLPSDFAGDMAPPMDFVGAQAPVYHGTHRVTVHDARDLQASCGSEDASFAEHGFSLLSHETRVTNWDTEIGLVYIPEITALLRERLLPGRRIAIAGVPSVTRRGAGRRHYAPVIHSDGPLTLENFVRNVEAFSSAEYARRWRQSYERDEVLGLIGIDFWRTTNMRAPLRHLPLAMCDPRSVDPRDIFPTTMPSLAPGGRSTHHLALRFNPGQAWYYYPEVTPSEVIALKMCEFWKDDHWPLPQNVFHTAFVDPTAPLDCEPRQSCECRLSVMILRD